MANKTLTAKVNIDVSKATQKIDSLIKKINQINAVVNKPNDASALEKKIEKQLLQQEKLRQATAKTQLAEERVATQKNKTALAAQKVNEATVKGQVAEQRLALQTERTRYGIERINNLKNKVATKTDTIKNKVLQWAKNQSMVNNSLRSSNGLLSSVGSKLKGLAATYLGIMGTKAMIGVSDTITSTQNKLNNLNGNDTNVTQNQMDKMYASANKVRMAYTDMLSNASKSMTLAGDAFQGNMDNAIRFQEIMAETYALGGASAEEMSSSMYQMIQALGAGTLAGDELRSVREGAPLAYKAIEEFAQGVYNTEESLKDLASQGKITSDMVVAAVMGAGDKIDKQFENTSMTFGQAWDRIKNSAIKAFEPVSNALNKMLNKAAENGAFEKIENAFFGISKALQITMELISRAITWIANNWDWLKHILIAGLILYASYLIVTTALAIKAAILRIKAWIIEHTAMLKTILIIALIMIAIYALWTIWQQFTNGAINACEAIVYALLIVGVAVLLVGILIGSVPMIVIGAIIVLLAVIFHFFEQVCGGVWWLVMLIVNCVQAILGFVTGVTMVILSIAINCIIGIINGAIALGSSIGVICDNIGIFFSNLWNGAKSAFWTFIGDVLTGLGDLEPAFNAIAKLFGLEGVTLSGLAQGAYDKANSANSKIEDYHSVKDAWNEGLNTFDYIDLGEAWSTGWNLFGTPFEKGWSSNAYNTGADWGAGVKDLINDWGSKFQNKGEDSASDKTSILDKIGNKLGLDFSNLGDGFPNPDDPLYDTRGAYNMPDDLTSGIGDIADNTGKMADSMDLADEDLKYLRKLAESEWKKEYTSNNIKIEMTNNNNVNSDSDLDGIVTKLSEKLSEELNILANGVYA